MSVLYQFADLFRGRTDVHGSDWGSCVDGPPDYAAHLSGEKPIGVYCLMPDLTVAWGCVDIDENNLELAQSLHECLRLLGIQAWVERSRSKGYHVWVFAAGPVPADVMRRALQAACQIIGYSPKEVNPKQVNTEHLDRGVGNYVRLPYPGVASAESTYYNQLKPMRQVMLWWPAPLNKGAVPWDLTLGSWLTRVKRVDRQTLESAAALYVEPPKPKPVHIAMPATTDTLTDKLGGKAWTIYRDGPLEGSDRSSTLAKLAHECRRCELTPGEALTIITDADARWGKYANRADGADQLRRIIERAYG